MKFIVEIPEEEFIVGHKPEEDLKDALYHMEFEDVTVTRFEEE